MNAIQLSNDKVLLTVFVTVLVGFLTAALSIVRLVNDKESKTTDYRQAWTDSLRKCFASLISNINTLASITTSRMSSVDKFGELMNREMKKEDEKSSPYSEIIRAYLDKRIFEEDEHIRNLRRGMHESYALTRLHFKPNDLSFARVEQKFDVVIELFAKLAELSAKESEGERLALREKIHAAAGEITAFSRDILKTEWEAVKSGEFAYQRTKFWSIAGGAIALVVLLVFGLATAWSMLRAEAPNSVGMGAIPSNSYAITPNMSAIVAPETSLPTSQGHTTQTVTIYGTQVPCLAQTNPSVQFKPKNGQCQLK